MAKQLDLDMPRAELRRDLGVARSQAAAERNVPGWTEIALGYVRKYAQRNAPFLTEECRVWAIVQGCPQPQNKKAWGAVMQSAQRRGIIEACGYAPAASSNCSPKVLWRIVR